MGKIRKWWAAVKLGFGGGTIAGQEVAHLTEVGDFKSEDWEKILREGLPSGPTGMYASIPREVTFESTVRMPRRADVMARIVSRLPIDEYGRSVAVLAEQGMQGLRMLHHQGCSHCKTVGEERCPLTLMLAHYYNSGGPWPEEKPAPADNERGS